MSDYDSRTEKSIIDLKEYFGNPEGYGAIYDEVYTAALEYVQDNPGQYFLIAGHNILPVSS